MARSFPLALQLAGKPCLLLGSSAETHERALALLEAGALLHVISEQPSTELRALATQHGFCLECRRFDAADLDGKWLAVSCDRDAELSARLAQEAAARRIFHCAIDQPEGSTFSHMARVRAGLVSLCISTEGRAPALGRRLRQELSRVIEASRLAEFAHEVAELRDRLKPSERKAQLESVVQGLRFEGQLQVPPAVTHEP
ncbi:MAG TPA: NAD(P)-dependent oxidoreductase [Polyangiaceae bacterium]|nr:NAD(P)-dependent oxidoreductase [Polyangiaceae bacterium]